MSLISAVLSVLLAAIVAALIFSQRFRKDLLAASGEANIGGVGVKGALFGVLMLLLVVGILYPEYQESIDIDKYPLIIKNDGNGGFAVASRESPDDIIDTFSAAELEDIGLFDRDRILKIPEFLKDANWVPVDKETGRTIELNIEQLKYKKERPPKDIFSKRRLKLDPGESGGYEVVLLSDDEYILGSIEYSTIRSAGLFRGIDKIIFPAEESPVITARFGSTWRDEDNIYPFSIQPILASYSIKIQSKEGRLITKRSANMGKLITFAVDRAHYAVTIGKVHVEEPFPQEIGGPYVQFRLVKLDFNFQ